MGRIGGIGYVVFLLSLFPRSAGGQREPGQAGNAALDYHGALIRSVETQISKSPVRVGPNVLVTADLPMHHSEVHMWAAPWDPNVLIGGGIAHAPVGRGDQRLGVYVSMDGGASWTGRLMPQTYGDPQVAAGTTPGTLIFVGVDYEGVFVHRSEDRGSSWGEPAHIGATDRPQIAVDYARGRFHGNMYLTGMGGCGPSREEHWYVLCLWRSSDEGRSWGTPVVFEPGSDTIGYNVGVPLVLSDGSLVLTYRSWWPLRAATKTERYVRVSHDGGLTFGERRLVHSQALPKLPRMRRYPVGGTSLEGWAVDTSARHRDRIYFAYDDDAVAPGRVFMMFSDDQGATWSEPVIIDPAAPPETEQQMPTVAVNKDGVVGVWWFDSRHAREFASPGNNFHDTYFAASLDGGESFLPAVRVSTESSIPKNTTPLWQAKTRWNDTTTYTVGVDVGPTMFPAGRPWGGEYAGMATDSRGVFWPLWPDARGSYQHVYTAAVVVEAGGDAPGKSASVDTIANSHYEIVLDPPRESGEVIELPLRVQNRSTRPLYSPLVLTVILEGESAAFAAEGDDPAGERVTTRRIALEPVIPGVLYPGQATAQAVIRIRKSTGSMPTGGGRVPGAGLKLIVTSGDRKADERLQYR